MINQGAYEINMNLGSTLHQAMPQIGVNAAWDFKGLFPTVVMRSQKTPLLKELSSAVKIVKVIYVILLLMPILHICFKKL